MDQIPPSFPRYGVEPGHFFLCLFMFSYKLCIGWIPHINSINSFFSQQALQALSATLGWRTLKKKEKKKTCTTSRNSLEKRVNVKRDDMREMTTTKSVLEALPEKKIPKSSAVPSPLSHRDHSAAVDSVRVLSATNSLSKTVTITSDCTYRTFVSCRGALVRLLERATCLEALLMEASPRQRSRYYDLTQKNKTKNIVKTSESEVLKGCVLVLIKEDIHGDFCSHLSLSR